jgi:hypothetical protein
MNIKITPKYVSPPKDGKKFGNVVTGSGNDKAMYMFMPGPVELKPGQEYDIEFIEVKWGESSVKVIKSVDGKPFQTDAKKGGGGGFKSSGNPKLDFAGRICAAAIIKGTINDKESLKKWFDMAIALADTAK